MEGGIERGLMHFFASEIFGFLRGSARVCDATKPSKRGTGSRPSSSRFLIRR
jgi:hypothetical protein